MKSIRVAGAITIVGCAGAVGTGRDDIGSGVPGIETTLAIEPTVVVPGETTTITLTISNTSENDVQFRFPLDRQVGLMIFVDGELQRVDGHTIPVPTYLSLGTFEEWTHELSWDGKVDRIELAPGRYELQVGLRRAGELWVNRSNKIAIEVEP